VASNATGILAPKTNVVAQETAKNPEDKTKPKLLGRPSRGRPTLSGIDRNILVTAPPSVVHLNSNSNEAGTVEHVRAAAGSPLVTEALHMVRSGHSFGSGEGTDAGNRFPGRSPWMTQPICRSSTCYRKRNQVSFCQMCRNQRHRLFRLKSST
jgi:hypothetical protein